MSVETLGKTTIWKIEDEAFDSSIIKERKSDNLRIIVQANLSNYDFNSVIRIANSYPKVSVVINKSATSVWSYLHQFESLFGIQAYGLNKETIAFLAEVPAFISKLEIGVDGENFDIGILSKFKALRSLSLSGKINDVADISLPKTIDSLSIYYFSKIEISKLHPLNNLKKLTIHHGSILSEEPLFGLSGLEELDIWKTRGFNTLDWLAGMKKLRSLSVGALSNVKETPPLDGHIKLERVVLEQMKSLSSVSSFACAPALKFLDLRGMNHVPLDDYKKFIAHPSLCELSSGFTSKKMNTQVEEMLGIPRVHYEPFWLEREI
jgi:hypothetical protein